MTELSNRYNAISPGNRIPAAPNCERCAKRAAEVMSTEVVLWFGDDWDDDHDALIEEPSKALACSRDSDGYRIARCLERQLEWEPDAELVEILDGAPIHEAHREAVKAWAENNGIQGGSLHGRSGKRQQQDRDGRLLSRIPFFKPWKRSA
jgi:hypothetical protein